MILDYILLHINRGRGQVGDACRLRVRHVTSPLRFEGLGLTPHYDLHVFISA